jgi:hypothetical protein
MYDDLERGTTGPLDEARQTSVSNWFYYLGRGITDGIDSQSRYGVPLNNAGVNFGVGADGSVYVQGSTGGTSKPAGLSISPGLILLAVGAWLLLRKA